MVLMVRYIDGEKGYVGKNHYLFICVLWDGIMCL